MAFICDDCQYIFSKKRSSCPFCGGRVYNSDSPESTLLHDGYSWAPGQKPVETRHDGEATNNPFEDLRQEFFDQQEPDTTSTSIPEVSPGGSTQKSQPQSQTTDPAHTASERDYFSQFDTSSRTDDIPVVDPYVRRTQTPPPVQPDPYEQELQELERQRQRIERQYRRRAALDSILNIRWPGIFRILLIIILITGAISIWTMRYAIFLALINLLVSLLPIVLVIWIVWYLIRSIFR